MYISPPTIRGSFGTYSLPPTPLVTVTLTAHELASLARLIEREAVEAEEDGQEAAARRLAWRAAALRDARR